MAQHIIVTDYDPRWPAEYEKESEKIKAILGENCVAIYHIGSTAVPGLAAKPIIDIMPVVRSLEKTDQKASEFEKEGYEYLGEFGIIQHDAQMALCVGLMSKPAAVILSRK